MELDEQPLRMIRSDTGRYAFAPGVSRLLNTYGLRFPEMRSPFPSPLWERSLKPVNDDSERREDDQGKVRLHLTLGNNQNDALP